MLTFLFWNLNHNQRLISSVSRLTAGYNIDILLFAESDFNPADVLSILTSSTGSAAFFHSPIGCPKIQVYSRFPDQFIAPLQRQDPDRFTVRRINRPLGMEILLVAVHLPDKRNTRDEAQSLLAPRIAARIQSAERAVGHRRTLVIGDFNMDPFEAGMVAATGLHALPTRRAAQRRGGERVLYGEATYQAFYNPTWQHWGDRNDSPAGTYYYETSDAVRRYWHLFDQVLLRPDLLPCFADDDLQILTNDGHISFLNNRRIPDARNVSDHLPVLLRLSI